MNEALDKNSSLIWLWFLRRSEEMEVEFLCICRNLDEWGIISKGAV